MSTETETTAPATEGTSPRNSGDLGCGRGCLFGVIALAVIGLGVVIVFWLWGPQIALGFMKTGFDKHVDEADLPVAEKSEIKGEVARLNQAFYDGKVDFPTVSKAWEAIIMSPPMIEIIVRNQHLKSSGLSKEELGEADTTLNRFTFGVTSRAIDSMTYRNVLLEIYAVDPEAPGNPQPKTKLSDDEIREFLAAAKKAADEAQVPGEVDPVDPSDVIKKIVDVAVGNGE